MAEADEPGSDSTHPDGTGEAIDDPGPPDSGLNRGSTAEAPEVGKTGARFGSGASRRPRERPEVGKTGARFRSVRRTDDMPAAQQEPLEPSQPEYQSAPQPTTHDVAHVSDEKDWDEVGGDEPDDVSPRVRPYTWTAGRTKSSHDLAVESLISTGDHGVDLSDESTRYEHRVIAELCAQPRSVAEVAASLSVPLGVARVLVGDMAELGIVVVHRTAGSPDGPPDLTLMERVLSGLRRL
ncbi:MAG: DUF742 domain-containing protein [Pseudonocardiaceae bacterium]